MSQIKQQKKRILTDKKRYLINRNFLSQSRTAIKNFYIAMKKNDLKKTELEFNKSIKLLDKLLLKKIKKSNYIKKHKSRLFQIFNSKKEKELVNKSQ